MVDVNKTTEELIFDAALSIFQKKGLAGARMQEIADAAGINKSMLHYYYRSKELLFKQVFLLSFKQFSASVIPLLNQPNTWEEKIPLLVAHYISSMQKNPDLPMFVINELRYNPDEFINIVTENRVGNTLFIQQLKEGMEKGFIRPIRPIQVMVSIISETVFPFIAQPMINYMTHVQETSWEVFIETRQAVIPEMLIKYLKEF
ncbi:TetR/AcrR family transcriptional regulator [Mucilaginibacter robiniae]|uniref:TetR/AcrR family transcriptional regulator n=1 Tax=Mucilaginibacter robiniae TaxID=2728022 RepID=A0A7L5E1H5_9SPHI|nr:TetR/AcrR family transcriptional regulator [Mucilaginibacter robiniae]QJD96358.1 TetR/AcrR family transcriptional regulator [Mucilaginibacter robiniae]